MHKYDTVPNNIKAYRLPMNNRKFVINMRGAVNLYTGASKSHSII